MSADQNPAAATFGTWNQHGKPDTFRLLGKRAYGPEVTGEVVTGAHSEDGKLVATRENLTPFRTGLSTKFWMAPADTSPVTSPDAAEVAEVAVTIAAEEAVATVVPLVRKARRTGGSRKTGDPRADRKDAQEPCAFAAAFPTHGACDGPTNGAACIAHGLGGCQTGNCAHEVSAAEAAARADRLDVPRPGPRTQALRAQALRDAKPVVVLAKPAPAITDTARANFRAMADAAATDAARAYWTRKANG